MSPSNRKTWNNKTKVLNNGNWKVGIVKIPSGGKIEPISIAGHKDAWKKAQKKPKKSITSEVINNINPYFNPDLTTFVW